MKNLITTIKRLSCLAAACLMMCLVRNAAAQPAGQTNYQWSAGGDKITWSQGANWTQGVAPLSDGTTYAIDTSVNAGGSLGPITIGASDVVAINDAIFGPLWGQTLNIYGSMHCGFGQFIWGDNNSGLTTINLFTNSSLYLNDTLAFGTAWWFPGGALVEMNVYSNAVLGVTWFQFGGHLNLYGGTVIVTNALNTGTATAPVFVGGVDSDATRAINLTIGSTMVLPAAYTATVQDWIARGILLVYGSPGNAAEITIDEANTNWPGLTVVTTTATNANPIIAVHIQVPRTNLYVGGVEQAQVLADYATVSNVNVTTLSGVGIIYQSSAADVATVSAAGQVRATGPGGATLKAIVGDLSNTVSVAVAPYTNTASLIHRYTFSDATDSIIAADSIGGTDWDGSLVYGATLTGSALVLNGIDGHVQLPAGILTNMDAVTIETWASFGTISNWSVLYTFGDTDGTFGHNYISFQPHTGAATAQTGIKNAGTEQNPWFTPVLDNYSNLHIAAVFHPEAGYCSIYTNGVLAAINSSITVTLTDAMSTGDPYNFIGRSLWSADPYLPVTMDEFRIYRGPLTVGQIKADAALGPNQLIGSSTSVSLAASVSGGNIALTWPTNSALVNLQSTPALGAAANWTSVSTGTLVIEGGNYKWTLPASSSASFFRLKN